MLEVAPAENVAPVSPSPVLVLETRNLSAWFGDRQVLSDVNLPFPENTITAIIGPSGCGKSTFLRSLNRFHDTTHGARNEGEVLYRGESIFDLDPTQIRKRIGMVFQVANPFPTMSIQDNVLSGLRLRGELGEKDPNQLAEKYLRDVHLWGEVKDRLKKTGGAEKLSGGQKQRLCIARSLAVEPNVLLMDEPCSALDQTATSKIEDLMREIAKTRTIIIVTHNLPQAGRVSDFTAFLLGAGEDKTGPGILVEHDRTSVMFQNPSDPRTESYITGRFG